MSKDSSVVAYLTKLGIFFLPWSAVGVSVNESHLSLKLHTYDT